MEDEHGAAGCDRGTGNREGDRGVAQRQPGYPFGDEPREKLQVAVIRLEQAAPWMKQRSRQEDLVILGPDAVPGRDSYLTLEQDPRSCRDRDEVGQTADHGSAPRPWCLRRLREQRSQDGAHAVES